MSRRFSWLVVLTSLFGVSTARADSVELRWQFAKGQVLKYQLKHREVRTVSLAEQKFETTTTIEYAWTWTVEEMDDQGQATLAQKFTALRVESVGKDFDFRYDSAQGNSAQDDYQKKLIHFYDQLRFGDYRVQMRADGRIVSVTGFDKLIGEINADSQILDFHALNLRDDSFAWYLQQALGVLPAKAVAVGDTWQLAQDTKLNTYGQLQGKNTYVREKPVEEGGRTFQVAKVSGTQALDMDAKWLGNPLRGALKTTKLEGTLRFDAKAHALARTHVQMDLAGDLQFGNETNPARMKIGFQHTLELEAR